MPPPAQPQTASDEIRVRMIIPIWGVDYVERWLSLSFASLRSEGNIYYLHRHCDFEIAIMTKAADAARMQADPRFIEMTKELRCTFVAIDEFFPSRGNVSYGVPLTLCYAKGIIDLGDKALGTYIIMMNADFVLSEGSLKSVLDKIKEGYSIIAAPSIRVVEETARPLVEGMVDRQAGILSISSREMMKIVHAHLHNTVKGRIVNDANVVDALYYHQIYWRISEDCLAARCFLVMPLCFRVEQSMTKVVCPVDYGFIAEYCPDGRFCILNDSDQIAMLELQERHSEAYLLRIAPRARTLDERLAILAPEILAQTSAWTTAEHRRSATMTLYFHASELPADINTRVRPLVQFTERILAAMPPPVSHIRHFHWLPAVRNYRFHMARGGMRRSVALLDDPRNAVTPTLTEMLASSQWTGGFWRRLIRYAAEQIMERSGRLSWFLLGAQPELGRALSGRTVLRRGQRRQQIAAAIEALLADSRGEPSAIYLGDIEPYAPPPPPHATVLTIREPFPKDADAGLHRRLADAGSAKAVGPVVVYAPLELLRTWRGLSDDIEYILRRHNDMYVVLMTPELQPRRVGSHAWMLSVILDLCSSERYEVAIGVLTSTDSRDPLRLLIMLVRPRFWVALPRLLLRYASLLFMKALSYRLAATRNDDPTFSALVVHLSRRAPRA